MTYRTAILPMFCFLMLNSGCRDGLFLDFKSLDDLEMPEHKSKLVVFANLREGQYSNIIYIGKTRGSLDTTSGQVTKIDSMFRDSFWLPLTFVGLDTVNALVELFKNGVLFDKPARKIKRLYDNSFNEYHVNEPIIADGATYRLRISAKGFETIESEQIMPQNTKLDSVKFLQKGLVIKDQYFYPNSYQFAFYFKDLEDSKEHYYSTLIDVDSYFKGQLDNLDPILNGKTITNEVFRGKPFQWRLFYSDYGNRNPQSGRFKLLSTTRDAYLFEQSRKLYFETRDNKFAEPTTLYSNIKNGYGIFTLSAVSEYYLRF